MASGEDLQQCSMDWTGNAVGVELTISPQVELSVEVVVEDQSNRGAGRLLVHAHPKSVSIVNHACGQLGAAKGSGG